MKFIKFDEKGKEMPYSFPNKLEEEIYIETSRTTWGGVPYDVIWGMNTSIYKSALKPKQCYILQNTSPQKEK